MPKALAELHTILDTRTDNKVKNIKRLVILNVELEDLNKELDIVKTKIEVVNNKILTAKNNRNSIDEAIESVMVDIADHPDFIV